MKDVNIRLAGPEDADGLNLALTSLSNHLGDAHLATTTVIAAGGWGSHPAFRAILAERQDAIVGVAVYSPNFSTSRGGVIVYVSDLWTAEAVRGMGLGRRLLGAIAHDATETWRTVGMKLNVYHTTPEARAFYERLGFSAATHHAEMYLDEAGFDELQEP